MAVNLPIITEFNGQGIDRAIAEFKKLEKQGDKAAFLLKKAFLPATAALGGLAAAAVPAVKAASDLNETISKSEVIFGRAAKEVQDFAKTAARSLGQSEQQALDAASTFAVFGKSAGLAGRDLATFATDFTQLASDLASFNNTTPEDAIQAIGAALRGESEPLRRYGVLLSDAVLKQEAMALGIYDGSGALTAQQKVLAAQAAIYKQTTDAQGDFLRTSEGLANQTRILSAEFDNAKAKIGQSLLPVLLQIMPKLVELAGWVSQNTETVIKLAGAVGGLSSAIVLANIGLRVYNITAATTRAVNTLLSGSFIATQVSIGGLSLAVGLLSLTLTEFYSMMKDPSAWHAFTQAGRNAFTIVNNVFFAVANQVRNAVTVVANGIIQMANTAIDALNRLVPGNPIPRFTEYEYARWNEGFRSFDFSQFMGGGAPFPNLTAENRGSAPIASNLAAALPNIVPPAMTGGGGGGSGGGGGGRAAAPTIPTPAFASPAISTILPDYFMADPNAAADRGITININGGMATANDIAETTVNALRQYNQVHGPIPIAVG